MIRKVVSLDEIKLNDDNPRTIKDVEFKKLVKSLKEFPEMIEAREVVVNTEGVILGGNMRYRAARSAGLKKIPVKVVDWPEEKQREFIIKDNVSNGDWDWDALANKWDTDLLEACGLDTSELLGLDGYEEIIERASAGSIEDYSDDTNYNIKNLVRRRINPEIVEELERGIESGEIRKEIAEIARARVSQCIVFNFDEIIKYYRSDDCTEAERSILRQLYLVFITVKEAFENNMLKLNTITGNIVDRKLMEQKTDEAD